MLTASVGVVAFGLGVAFGDKVKAGIGKFVEDVRTKVEAEAKKLTEK